METPAAHPCAVTSACVPDPLAIIVADLQSAGVRVTPLNVIARATDIGQDDEQILVLIKRLEDLR